MASKLNELKGYAIGVLLSLVIAISDWLTGNDLSFYAFYFLPVALSAWFVGMTGAFLVALVCTLFWFGALYFTGHAYPSTFYTVWNTMIRFVSFLAIGWSVSETKHALDQEIEKTRQLRTSISERKKTEEALRELTSTLEQQVAERTEMAELRAEQLHKLTIDLIESEERERKQLSELLHDDLQQVLSAALLHLDGGIESAPSVPELAQVQALIKESINKARNLSHELSPAVLHYQGLLAGLKWLADHMNEKFGLNVQLETDINNLFDFSSVQVFVFRAVQELLFNIVKHSGVKTARIGLSSSKSTLFVTVSDVGQGFNIETLCFSSSQAGIGLLSIQERARFFGGALKIESAPGQGCRFTLEVPISILPSGGV